MRALRIAAAALLALLLLAALFVLWALNTGSGARWVARTASGALGEQLAVGGVSGTIAGPLVVTDLRYRNETSGLALELERAALELELGALLRGTVHVRELALQGLSVALGERQPPQEERPFSLEPPIDLVLDAAVLERARISRAGETLLVVERAALAGRWTDAGLAVRRLELHSPQGMVRFAGRVAARGAAPSQAYVGAGSGSFRWQQLGELRYAGTLAYSAQPQRATLTAQLTAPLRASLEVSLRQRSPQWPWQLALEVPRFDPRRQLTPDGAIASLAASLRAEGSATTASATGRLLVDGVPLRLEPLRLRWQPDERRLALELLQLQLADGEGLIRVSGTVRLADEPVSADLDLSWQDLVVPQRWAGQTLHTRGQASIAGSAAAYRASGELALGPPGRLADASFRIRGSPRAIEIERLAIVERLGRLTAEGTLQLEPLLAWRLSAQAARFDPGVLLPEWPGRLGFSLETEGRWSEAGPQAHLLLERLRGTLRQRPVAGHGDLTLTPDRVLAGELQLRSGRSLVRVQGRRGERLDASARFEIASLGDWIPDAAGRLHGRVEARGRWPQLRIDARARGRDLRLGDARVAALGLSAEATDPTAPSGTARLELTDAAAAGFDIESLVATATGSMAEHRLELTARGAPLGAELRLGGALAEGRWTGTIGHLALALAGEAHLALQEPARVSFGQGALELSHSCLADDDIRLCLAASGRLEGPLEASYTIANLPLGLAAVFAPAGLPIEVDARIDGRGELRRTAGGALFGELLLESEQGMVGEGLADGAVPLRYRELRLVATLEGDTARAELASKVLDGGQLQGELSVAGLRAADPRLAGRAELELPTIAPLGMLTPQIADVRGRVQARLTVAGTLGAPQLAGALRASDMGAEIPRLGLQLTDGTLQAALGARGDIALEGGVSSGGGRISFDGGTTSAAGALRVAIRGRRFVAADIPGVHVLATPDLVFTRTAERMRIEGEVLIPRATVNLQRLPAGGPQQASADVVVIDDAPAEEEAAGLPLYAEVRIVLGEEVEVEGFGLEATVEGSLVVHEQPAAPTTGSGEIRVAGTYRAYGQNLEIQQGQLLYAGTPLDDPRLAIVAVRKLEDVTAGLRIGGTARQPELSVFSDPAMGQANALSYLVAGKPLAEIGAGTGESDALQSAARSIQTAAGGLVARSVGRRLGVDEVGVQQSELLGGAALTIGEYLSPRLYVSYGFGLFEPGDIVTLRYRLSDELSIQAQRGPEETRTGIEYRIER